MALGVDGVRVGSWTAPAGHTGCTVVLPPPGTLGGVAVRGGAPGTREAAALGPVGNVGQCHAIVLSGGSAFGLATADGVMRWCEARGIGFDMAVARIPIVGAAIVFDLHEAGAQRPDAEAGSMACDAASEADPEMGRVGVGAGCTVGKTAGLAHLAPGGQGWAVASGGGITVGALMAVNALGDVLDEQGRLLAGSSAPPDAPRFPFAPPLGASDATEHGANTVIGCLATNARLTKPEACRAADLAHTGIARAVDPVHTSYDGDALFLLATQQVPTTVDVVAHLGAQAVAAAIRAAVRAAC
jgi:L-aminopeptidase/D-esterase-like protein